MNSPAPAWLAKRPSYRAAWLQGRNALRRSRAPWFGAIPVLGALALLADSSVAGQFAAVLAEHPSALYVFGVLILAAATLQRKHRLRDVLARSWLAPLPIRVSRMERVAVAMVPLLGALELLLAASIVAGRLPARVSLELLLVLAGGGVTGFAAGWLLPQRRSTAVRESHYAAVRRARDRWATHPRLLPLGYWAAGQARSWTRPRLTAPWAALVLLALPMGISGAAALAVAGAALVVRHLAVLLLGIVRVAFAAAWWLAPTPIAPLGFMVSVAYLALLKQVAIAALLLCGALALGGAPMLGIGLKMAMIWMLACGAVSALACACALAPGTTASSALHRWLR